VYPELHFWLFYIYQHLSILPKNDRRINMIWATEPLELSSGKIYIRSLRESDFETIAGAIHDPNGWSGQKWGLDTPEKIQEMLKSHLEAHAKGECSPFVYFVGDDVAGISRYLHLAPNRKTLEIGGTCVAPKWRRTFVNTEVKRLLLGHAFENLDAVRVELRVDCLNYVSQMNVLRLGAGFEGKIRHWQVRKNAEIPDGMLYSITNKEWPSVKHRLDLLRSGQQPRQTSLPHMIKPPRLTMRLNKLHDAQPLLELVQRNSKCLIETFRHTAALNSSEDAKAYIAEKSHSASANSAFYYGVWKCDSDTLIGQLQIKNINWKSNSAELGYFLDLECRRQGFCFEMLKGALAELFDRQKLRRITLRILPNNEPSIQLAKNLDSPVKGRYILNTCQLPVIAWTLYYFPKSGIIKIKSHAMT
jgi:RimJ/RimL family protein N-acetyltransferase